MSTYGDHDTLTTSQCAALTGHHRRTVINWIRNGQLVAQRRGPSKRSHYLIKFSDLRELLPHLRSPHAHETALPES